MLLRLFLAFTLIPIMELYLLIKIGHYIGAFATVLLVIGTGFLGAYLARLQGFRTLMRIKESVYRGESPAEEMVDAMLIFVAGVVLLTPGLLTDIAGLMLLMPEPRTRFKRWLRKKFDKWIAQNRIDIIMP
jgi:UPF0716 protein FxsA